MKTVQITPQINNMVIQWIQAIDGIYAKNNPVKDDGYAIRIPLTSPLEIHNKWLDTIVKEIYIVIPKDEPSFFMIIEKESRLICFPFHYDIATLSKILNFKLK